MPRARVQRAAPRARRGLGARDRVGRREDARAAAAASDAAAAWAFGPRAVRALRPAADAPRGLRLAQLGLGRREASPAAPPAAPGPSSWRRSSKSL